jgi:hypothetical protein
MTEWFDKKIVGSALLIGTIIAAALLSWTYVINPALQPVPTPPPYVTPGNYLYTQGLTVNFKLLDATAAAPVTADVGVALYSSTATPLALVSTDVPIALASYDSVANVWQMVANAGSYQLVIVDINTGSEIFYPTVVSVTVPGTNLTTMTVNLNPYLIPMTERGTPAIVTDIGIFDPVTALYSTGETDITDPGTSAKWQITYSISVAGLNTGLAAGRIYLPIYPALSMTSAKVNGITVAVKTDADGSDDGLTGYYVEFPALQGGAVTVVNVVLTRTGAFATGTYTMTLYENYLCHNAALRWWVDETSDVDVIAL